MSNTALCRNSSGSIWRLFPHFSTIFVDCKWKGTRLSPKHTNKRVTSPLSRWLKSQDPRKFQRKSWNIWNLEIFGKYLKHCVGKPLLLNLLDLSNIVLPRLSEQIYFYL